MKIECECGHLISDGTDDLPHKAHIIPDQRWNPLFEAMDDVIENRCGSPPQRADACTRIRSLVNAATRLAWQCRSCGSLYFEDSGGSLQRFAPVPARAPGEGSPQDDVFRS